jgi:transcriptional regulator with XRE-family HTH domain
MLAHIDHMTALDAFGRFIRRRRERMGWSQRDLEEATGIDQTVISRIENGRFRNARIHQIAPMLCVLAPEILEIRRLHARMYAELTNWEAVRPYEPPILLPPEDEPVVRFYPPAAGEPAPRPVTTPFARVERPVRPFSPPKPSPITATPRAKVKAALADALPATLTRSDSE